MAFLGIPYTVEVSPVDERLLALSGLPSKQAMDCAVAKATAVAEAYPEHWVLGADTIVCIDGQILGKPEDRDDAHRLLSMLSGRMHIVTTGVCLIRHGQVGPPPIAEETRVWMMPLTKDRIEAYIDTGEPMDKAGAYGIQGFGGAWIPRIEGCYFNVMGLPLYRVAQLIESAGIPLGSIAGEAANG